MSFNIAYGTTSPFEPFIDLGNIVTSSTGAPIEIHSYLL